MSSPNIMDAIHIICQYVCPMNSKELEERLIKFSADVTKFVDSLPSTFSIQHLKIQLLRSSSSAALNYGEARAGESKKEFTHKIKIVLKELRESLNNFRLIDLSKKSANKDELKNLLKEANELVSIFVASVKTAEENSSGTK